MKTLTAFLAHVGITGLQIAAAVPFFDQHSQHGILANTAVQIGAQSALSGLQAYVAHKNSNTDPDGKPLAASINGGFATKKD